MKELTVVLLHVAAIGQTGFVILWATCPWWRLWIGRALMIKSASLMVYLDYALAYYYWPDMPSVRVVGAILFALVTVGIVSQLAALSVEIFRGQHRRE